MAPYEALYGRKCRSPLCWSDIGESCVLGPEMIQDTIEQVKLIQQKMKAAQDRQKSYAYKYRRHAEFEVGEKVLLKVSPIKGVMRFGMKGKLSPKFIGPYKILERIGEVAYRLTLPLEIARVHNVFHISQLRRYISDPSHVLTPDELQLEDNLSYVEVPMKILDSKVRATRNGEVKLVKVLWSNHKDDELSWKSEDAMRAQYPHLFQ
ncbi:uncharacterized protein LOC130590487 [Beta vulgaris subsp. vulgaris]|uniref:uncharacterized protein LOC130590487 n=1 Tax=Beta vulgaris subsp. vulgaris TaxID=3555 RepID=UPI002547FCCF|nr:uncharacterized protein LOC130590487 [Beta vulgaris subsp. vulgaris]